MILTQATHSEFYLLSAVIRNTTNSKLINVQESRRISLETKSITRPGRWSKKSNSFFVLF